MFGARRELIEILKLYIDAEGDAMTPGNIIDEDTFKEMKKLQDVWKDVDPEEHSVIKKEIEKQRNITKLGKDRLNS